jgi:hypothetical protein
LVRSRRRRDSKNALASGYFLKEAKAAALQLSASWRTGWGGKTGIIKEIPNVEKRL